jgi:acetyl esterase/lipase
LLYYAKFHAPTKFRRGAAADRLVFQDGGACPCKKRPNQASNSEKNVAYANHDGVELTGDLYLPSGPGPFPLIVNVHGGYWRRGSRDTFQHWGPYLAERGYAGFTISYRLTKPGKNNSTFPGVVSDVRAAVQFMRGSARSSGSIPDRVAIWGNSAGAHLAAMVALAGESPLFKNAYPQDKFASVSSKVKVLIGTYGIYDLLAQWKHSQIQNPRRQSRGVAPRRVADAEPQALFRRLADQLRDLRQQQDRRCS